MTPRAAFAIPALLVSAILFALAPSAQAERLLIQRAEAAAAANLPDRGLSMAQVEARFGAPTQKLEPRGGQSAAWPIIHRWVYPEFTVYFEHNRVINAVLNRAAATEIGPAPAAR